MDYYHERYYERLRWIRKRIAEYYWLSDKDVYYTTEYGSTPILSSRLNTAIKRLLDIFVIERIGKGTYQITEFGKQVIKAYPGVVFDVSERTETETLAQLDLDGDGVPEKISLHPAEPVTGYSFEEYMICVNLL